MPCLALRRWVLASLFPLALQPAQELRPLPRRMAVQLQVPYHPSRRRQIRPLVTLHALTVPQFEVHADGVWLAQVDLAWPEHRVVVEYEGAYHFDGVQIARDDRRYERLVAAGWTVIRLAAHDVRDMADVVRRIAAALGRQV